MVDSSEPLTQADEFDNVDTDDVHLSEAVLGFNISVAGEHVGTIEGVPGQLDHIEIQSHWEGKGVGRAALNNFIELSREHGEEEVTTNNAVHPAMEHILDTEGFSENPDGIGWAKKI
jgi:GNAT superfamily N-acetyltransferase